MQDLKPTRQRFLAARHQCAVSAALDAMSTKVNDTKAEDNAAAATNLQCHTKHTSHTKSNVMYNDDTSRQAARCYTLT